MKTLLLPLAAGLALAAPALAADEIDDLIAEGRHLLEGGRAEAAEAVFQKAADTDGGTLRTRMWVLRAWQDQGRINDALREIDALVEDGAKGDDVDYLYGMAFARRADDLISSNAAGNALAMNLMDAQAFLERVTAADPERYRDGLLPLARAAWFNQDLEASTMAVERAVERFPKDPHAWYQRGRTALSAFGVAQGDASDPEGVDALWARALESFQKSVALFGEPEEPFAKTALAQAALQLGYTHQWREQKAEAGDAFVIAMEWDPTVVAYDTLNGFFELEVFRDVLGRGAAAYEARYGKETQSDATLLWWYGWTLFSTSKYKEAEPVFVRVLEKWPDYTNSWYYLARARYSNQDYREAIEAFRQMWTVDAEGLIAAVQGDSLNLDILEYLTGLCYQVQKYEEATAVKTIMAESQPDNAFYWNDLGLFHRDHGDKLKREAKEGDEEAVARYMELYEASIKAYGRALDLEPENPAFLNDAAVIYHYCLQRDYDRARDMYVRSNELATKLLEDSSLEARRRQLYEVAKRDSADNLAKLEKKIEREKKRKGKGKAGGE